MQNAKEKYLIVDGSNYLFRSYFGVPKAANFRGVKVNAVYVFFAILRRITEAVEPAKIIVVFDSETGIQGKIEERPEYKATRELSDTGMYVQLPMIKVILERCNIEWIEPPNHEADDVIGSLAAEIARKDGEAFVSSNDLDFAQIIDPCITLVRDIRGEAIFITEKDFIREWGFEPAHYRDYLAIKGDPPDNVYVIQWIGPKTERGLIQKYTTIEEMFQHLSDLSRGIASKILPEIDKLLSNLHFLKIDTELVIGARAINYPTFNFSQEALYKVKTNGHLISMGIGQ